jgi:two-component system, LytTR family, sensor kinase
MPPVWAIAAVTLALGVLFGMIEAGQTHWRDAWNNRPSTWAEAVWRSLPGWVLFGLLAPAAYVLTRRFRLDRQPRWPAAIAHIIAATLFAVIHPFAVASFYVVSTTGTVPLALIVGKAQYNLLVNFALDIGIYCAFAGAFHALLFYRDLRARELAASQLQTVLTQARLETLRAQLNPHFLFNTLNAISSLALKGEQQGVVQMLSLLSDLLRLSLDGHLPQEIALADEIAFIDRYLELQRIRFSDRLNIGKVIEDATLQARVPSLLLQPIVENAVLHGIAVRRGPGRIDIRAARDGDRLLLEVTDTGPGFAERNGKADAADAAAAAGAAAAAAAAGAAADDGVGLRNTRARLQHLYGDAQSLSCRNLDTGGASVMIRIPFVPIAPVGDGA